MYVESMNKAQKLALAYELRALLQEDYDNNLRRAHQVYDRSYARRQAKNQAHREG